MWLFNSKAKRDILEIEVWVKRNEEEITLLRFNQNDEDDPDVFRFGDYYFRITPFPDWSDHHCIRVRHREWPEYTGIGRAKVNALEAAIAEYRSRQKAAIAEEKARTKKEKKNA